MTLIIQSFYEKYDTSIHNSKSTKPLEVTTRVRQGCLMSPNSRPSSISNGWGTEKTTEQPRRTFTEKPEDLVFADDINVMSHTHRDRQAKTNNLQAYAQLIGLNQHQENKNDENQHNKNHQWHLLELT